MSNKTNEQKFELLKKVMNPMLLLGGGPRGFTPLGPVPTEMMDDVSSIRDEYRTALIIYEVAMGCLLNPQKEIANAGYHLHRIAIGETFKSSSIRHVIHDLQYHALDIPKIESP
jgi:hypothetical protein